MWTDSRSNCGASYDAPPPPGIHAAAVDSASEQVSKGGKPQIKLTLRIPHARGVALADLYLTAGAFVSLWDGLYEALVPECADAWESGGPVSWDPVQIVGRTCRVRTESEMYQGKARTRVAEILPAAPGQMAREETPF